MSQTPTHNMMSACCPPLMLNLCWMPTIKAVARRRVRFLGIGRRVEVGEKSRDRAVTVTFKSALGSNYWPVYRPVFERHSSDALSMSLCLIGVWPICMDCLGCPKFGPAPDRNVRCPIGHRLGFRCFKYELKVTRCPPDSQKWPGSRNEYREAPVDLVLV